MSEELAVRSEEIQSLVVKTNEALTLNQTSVERAKQAGFALLDEIEQKGMSDEMDEKANGILVKIRKTNQAMMERRKPVTQLFDQLKKVFTGLEGELDPKKAGSVYSQIQDHRDTYATEKAAEAERIRKEAERKLAIENEKTSTKSAIELALNNYFEEYLESSINHLSHVFNGTTIEDYQKRFDNINSFSEKYPREHFDKFSTSVRVIYIDGDMVTSLIGQAKSEETFKKFSEVYWSKIDDLKINLLEKMPGKLKELEAIAEAEKANAEEAERLKQEAAKREAEEKKKQAQEAESRRKEAELAADQKKQAEQMQNMFDATPTESVNTAQVRTGYEITVTHQKGWIEIFNFWFLKEGFDLPIDAIERKSLGQMKTFCQNIAAKEGEKIQSPYIKYKETFKAVAKA